MRRQVGVRDETYTAVAFERPMLDRTTRQRRGREVCVVRLRRRDEGVADPQRAGIDTNSHRAGVLHFAANLGSDATTTVVRVERARATRLREGNRAVRPTHRIGGDRRQRAFLDRMG